MLREHFLEKSGSAFFVLAASFCRNSQQYEEDLTMKENYKAINSMKEVPDQLRKLRRQYLRYQQAELVYSLSHKKLLELASAAAAGQRKLF